MYTIPDQFYYTTLEWVMEYLAGHYPNELLYKVIHPAETIQLPAPKGVDPVRWPTTCYYQPAFTTIIPFGRVATGCGFVVAPDNKRILDVELYYSYPFTNLPDPIYLEETVATLIWGWNLPGIGQTQAIYGHWFFDILPRIHLLEASGISIDKYLVGVLEHSFQWESLELLGFPTEKLIQVDRNDFHFMARNLIVPAVPFHIGKSPRWAVEFIQQRFKHSQNITLQRKYERVFITRQDAKARYVLNEEEVFRLLSQKGFTMISLTHLSVAEKVSIFSSAKAVIAPIGSGNVHLAFCSPGTTVIELTPETVIDDYFWKISGHAQLDYYQLLCEIKPPPQTPSGRDSFYVDIPKLTKVLTLAGI